MAVALIVVCVLVVTMLLVFEIRGLIKDIRVRKALKKKNHDKDVPSKIK